MCTECFDSVVMVTNKLILFTGINEKYQKNNKTMSFYMRSGVKIRCVVRYALLRARFRRERLIRDSFKLNKSICESDATAHTI